MGIGHLEGWYLNCKRVCKIVQHFENARFSYVLALEKKNGSGYKKIWLK